MGVLVYAFFENKDSLIMVAVNCVFPWLFHLPLIPWGYKFWPSREAERKWGKEICMEASDCTECFAVPMLWYTLL